MASSVDYGRLKNAYTSTLESLQHLRLDPQHIIIDHNSPIMVGGFGIVRKGAMASRFQGAVAVKELRPCGSPEQRLRVMAVSVFLQNQDGSALRCPN